MLDLSYFQNQNSNVQGFFNAGTWSTWVKPRGAKMVNIICVGSGAGGGGGFQSTTTPRGGGSSGGSGAIARLTINASLLPDVLYILPGIGGKGGLGGSPATSGSSGQNSFVTLTPSTGSTAVLRSGTTPATGGVAGTTINVAAGVGETSLLTSLVFLQLGVFNVQAGATGGNGNTTIGGGTTITNPIGQSSGGGGNSTGGTILGAGVFPTVTNAPLNTNGQNGFILYKPTLMLYGGTGGGGSVTGNGGNGGNGAPGTGGGGGGASANTGVNAGNGGDGGNGFVIITTSF